MEIQDDLEISPEQKRAFDSVTCGVCSRWALEPIVIACKVPHVGYTCESCLQMQYNAADGSNCNANRLRRIASCHAAVVDPKPTTTTAHSNTCLGIWW